MLLFLSVKFLSQKESLFFPLCSVLRENNLRVPGHSGERSQDPPTAPEPNHKSLDRSGPPNNGGQVSDTEAMKDHRHQETQARVMGTPADAE